MRTSCMLCQSGLPAEAIQSQLPAWHLDGNELPLVTLTDGALVRPFPGVYPPMPRKAR